MINCETYNEHFPCKCDYDVKKFINSYGRKKLLKILHKNKASLICEVEQLYKKKSKISKIEYYSCLYPERQFEKSRLDKEIEYMENQILYNMQLIEKLSLSTLSVDEANILLDAINREYRKELLQIFILIVILLGCLFAAHITY